VVVGKDILELVSTAMYPDPLTIYREYVQNAADAIDMAVQERVISSRADGRIEVKVDHAAREARVRDNGSGVPAATAAQVLSAFGASGKRGQGVRGFRGIGRLAALGFCQALTFTTKASGEAVATEVRWDCRRLRNLLQDPEYGGTLEDIVREVVKVITTPSESLADHYFEVHLQHVVRLRGDALLNEDAIRRYLAQVAPVPFAPDFPFAADISAFLQEHLPNGHFEIVVGEAGQPLVRPHRSSIQVTQTKRDTYVSWDSVVLRDPDLQTPAAVGWIAHHNYLGAISAEPEVRGLRARVGDIQVGDAELFAWIFAESRFNAWVIGELHVLDPRVVPNGRRDDFEHHPAVASLHNRLGPLGRTLSQRTRESSKSRTRVKAFDRTAARLEGVLTTLEEGLVRGVAARAMVDEVGEGLQAMEKLVASDSFPADDPEGRPAVLAALRERYEAVDVAEPTGPHPLEHLSPSERNLFDRVMGIVFECAGSAEAGRALLEQVTKRVAAS
jgi:molecular chaperone HtpG